jgi:peptidoglycan/xylan/chitin deacetylase (PgdA/CDA1 family)
MTESKGAVLLSFDVEEFDMPLEYGQQVSLNQQMQTGYDGFKVMIEILDSMSVPATLFSTANFADHFESDIRSVHPRHELASHTYYHSNFNNEDLLRSRQRLEEISGRKIKGLRMPRMRSVDMYDVKNAGYVYDSSVYPTWIPGRFNNLNLPRTIYQADGMLRMPASVSPTLRIPLFWLAFKNFPYSLFLLLVKQTIAKDGYACLYFHPWEFVDLSTYHVPAYTKRLAGKPLRDKLTRLIADLKNEYRFATIEHYLQSKELIA